MGMDFVALVNRLVEVASARYFGTPDPPQLAVKPTDPKEKCFAYITAHRDGMESRLRRWCSHSSRTSDIVGRQRVVRDMDRILREILMRPHPVFTNDKVAWTWETRAGLEGGTLIVCQIDVPFELSAPYPGFRRDPEWVYSEGIGSVWAPLTMLEYALRSLALAREVDSPSIEGSSLATLGNIASARGRMAEALHYIGEHERLARRMENQPGIMLSQYQQALVL